MRSTKTALSPRLQRCLLGLIGPAVEQPQYNLLEREKVEREFRWLYTAHGTGLTTFAPLKIGILTGKYNDVTKPPAGSRMAESSGVVAKHLSKTFGDETWISRLAVVAGLKPIAEELGCTLAQLSLARILMNPQVSAPLLGASRPEQVRENLGALEVKAKLTAEVMDRIEGVVKNKPKVEPLRFG
ncbi:Aldo/keto reductase [Cryphonectria parasitica EP155]|uniref:Aldo/keto reductase n=1 Tax=Cryphonectria parasitica (strain ATCC 38755 / EP155) TaxID=660469 RepID=A0A9P4YAX8_CRYP1|nr:Aldo/keto reductase [Cryphonectria parasitica EP155]KAF3769688.1 Aldo/keto reductase [Cryphonectria parasitica EP155]